MPVRPRLLLTLCSVLLLIAACGSSGPQGTGTPHPVTPTASPATANHTPEPAGDIGDAPVHIPVAGQAPQAGVPWYLAIGDSITFGFSADPARFGTNSSWALQLQDLLAGSGRPWKLYDTACPSETTTTYFSHCPRRELVPFLAGQSQHDAALAAIHAHLADLRLIVVDLGSNDLLRALRSGENVVTAYGALRVNLDKILGELTQAAPSVPLVVANYYDPLENSQPATVTQLGLVNDVVRSLAASHHARLADFFAAINTPSPPDPDLGKYVDLAHFDIHPTVAGHARLAQAALAALGAA